MRRDMFVVSFCWHIALLMNALGGQMPVLSFAFMPHDDGTIRKYGFATSKTIGQHASQKSNAATAGSKTFVSSSLSSLLTARGEPPEEDPTSGAYSPSSYGPFQASWKSTGSSMAKNSTYLGSLGGASGDVKASYQVFDDDDDDDVAKWKPATSPLEQEHQQPLMSSESPTKASSFAPNQASWKLKAPTVNNSYVGSLSHTKAKPASDSLSDEPVKPAAAPLMESSAPIKASSFAPNQATWKLRAPAVNNSYIGSLSRGKAKSATDSASEEPAKPAGAPLVESSAPLKASSFAPNMAAWKVRGPKHNNTYLGLLAGGQNKTLEERPSSTAADVVAPPSAQSSGATSTSPVSYEATPPTRSTGAAKASSYAPDKASWKSAAPKVNNTYIGSLTGKSRMEAPMHPEAPAASAAVQSAPATPSVPAPPPISPPVTPMVQSTVAAKGGSYSPDKASWKSAAPKVNNTYIGSLTGKSRMEAPMHPEAPAASAAVQSAPATPSVPASPPISPPVTPMVQSTVAAKGGSYSPDKASWKSAAPKVNNTYIGSLTGKSRMEAPMHPEAPATSAAVQSVPATPSVPAPPPISPPVTPMVQSTVAAKGGSYSPDKASWKSAAPKVNNTYIGSLTGKSRMEAPLYPEAPVASPPVQSVPAAPSVPASPPVSPPVTPMVQSTVAAKGGSYSPDKASWKSAAPKVNNTFIGSLTGKSRMEAPMHPEAPAASPPVQSVPATPIVPASPPVSPSVTPMVQSTVAAKGGSYSPEKAAWKSAEPKVNNTYIGSLTGKSKMEAPLYPEAPAASAPIQPGPATPSLPVSPPASAKSGSYSPDKASWKSAAPKVNNTYIGSLAGKSRMEAPLYPEAPAASAPVPSGPARPSVPASPPVSPPVTPMVQSTASAKGGSYSPDKASWKSAAPKVNNTYIGSLAGSFTRESLSYPEAAPTPVKPSPASSSVPVSSPVTPVTQSTSPAKKGKSYLPNKNSWKSVALKYNNTYIGSLAGSLSMETHSYPTAPKTQTWNAPAPASQPLKLASPASVPAFVTPPSYAPSRQSLKTKVGASTLINTGSVIAEGGIGKASESFSNGMPLLSKAADKSSSRDEGLFDMRAKAFRDAKARAHTGSEKILNLPVPGERAASEEPFSPVLKPPLKVKIGSRQTPPPTVPAGRIVDHTARTAASPNQRVGAPLKVKIGAMAVDRPPEVFSFPSVQSSRGSSSGGNDGVFGQRRQAFRESRKRLP